jgi:hypothetical protein
MDVAADGGELAFGAGKQIGRETGHDGPWISAARFGGHISRRSPPLPYPNWL